MWNLNPHIKKSWSTSYYWCRLHCCNVIAQMIQVFEASSVRERGRTSLIRDSFFSWLRKQMSINCFWIHLLTVLFMHYLCCYLCFWLLRTRVIPVYHCNLIYEHFPKPKLRHSLSTWSCIWLVATMSCLTLQTQPWTKTQLLQTVKSSPSWPALDPDLIQFCRGTISAHNSTRSENTD